MKPPAPRIQWGAEQRPLVTTGGGDAQSCSSLRLCVGGGSDVPRPLHHPAPEGLHSGVYLTRGRAAQKVHLLSWDPFHASGEA